MLDSNFLEEFGGRGEGRSWLPGRRLAHLFFSSKVENFSFPRRWVGEGREGCGGRFPNLLSPLRFFDGGGDRNFHRPPTPPLSTTHEYSTLQPQESERKMIINSPGLKTACAWKKISFFFGATIWDFFFPLRSFPDTGKFYFIVSQEFASNTVYNPGTTHVSQKR